MLTFQQWVQDWLGITQLQNEVKKMADILDSELASMATVTSDLATLLTDVQTLITDFQNSPGGIQSSDPRWQTLSDAINTAAQNVSTLDASVQAAINPPPPPAAKP